MGIDMKAVLVFDDRLWDVDFVASIALLNHLGVARTVVAVACALRFCYDLTVDEAMTTALSILFPAERAPLHEMLRQKVVEEIEKAGGAKKALERFCTVVASVLAKLARPRTKAEAINALNAIVEKCEKCAKINANCLKRKLPVQSF